MTEIDLNKITRFEVIDEQGRKYVRWARGAANEPFIIELHVQDDGRTLKVFINPDHRVRVSM